MRRPALISRVTRLALCLLSCAGLHVSVASADSSITLTVNRTELSEQQTLQATVKVSLEGNVSGANLDEPSWEQQGWSVLNRAQQSSMQIFNRQRSLSVSYVYQLKPTRSGELTLGPFKGLASISGLQSNVAKVKVYEGPPKVTPAQQKRNNRYALMRWEADKETIWLGQQLDVTLALYINTELRVTQYVRPDLKLPSAWLEDVEVSGRSRRARLGSDVYYRKEAEHKLISPLKAGEFTLPKLTTSLSLMSLGFGRVEEEITVVTPPKTIKVKALPPNPPKGFRGPTVGHVKLEAFLDRSKLRTDEGVQLTIKTTTDGLLHNTSALELPYIDGLKSFPPTSREKKLTNPAGSSVRSQTWLLKPTRAGKITIPPVTLPFFNPTEGVYQVAETPALKLTVTGDEAQISATVKGGAQAGRAAERGAQGDGRQLALEGLGVTLKSIRSEALPIALQTDLRWLWRLLALLGLGAWLYELLSVKLKSLKALGGSSSQKERALARVTAALSALRNQATLDHAELDELLRGYLEARFELDLRGLTREQTSAQLQSSGLQRPYIEGYQELCERLDFLRFAQTSDDAQGAQLLQLSLEWVRQVDSAARTEGASSRAQRGALPVLLLLSLAPSVSHASPELSPERASHEAFWAGDIKRAMSGYQALLTERPDDPNLWYNLGTTYAHLGRFGEASYALQMGLKRAPHDQEAQAQLERVLQAVAEDGSRRPGPRRLVLPDSITSAGGLLAFVSVQGAESLLWAALSLLGFGLWINQRARREGAPRPLLALQPAARVTSVLMGVVCLLAAGAWWLRHTLVDQREVGVVIEARAPLRRGPAERFPAEVNVAGSVKVQLQGAEGDWRRVVLFDGREGWLHQEHVRALK